MSIKPKLSKSNTELVLDLKEIFGESIPSKAKREDIAQAAIDKIVERTQAGKSFTGHSFKGYSKAYKNSAAFEAFGKSKQVNMTLKGDMLALFNVKKSTKDKIVLGWTDETENAKAYNHNVGDTVPKRAFLGLTNDEVKELKDEFET